MKQSVTVGAQLLWSSRYGCNNGRYGCTIVMSYIEINKAVSQWLLTFNLCVSVTWPLTCAFHIPCTHTSEIIDMHRGMCDKCAKLTPHMNMNVTRNRRLGANTNSHEITTACVNHHIDGLVQDYSNSSALAICCWMDCSSSSQPLINTLSRNNIQLWWFIFTAICFKSSQLTIN